MAILVELPNFRGIATKEHLDTGEAAGKEKTQMMTKRCRKYQMMQILP